MNFMLAPSKIVSILYVATVFFSPLSSTQINGRVPDHVIVGLLYHIPRCRCAVRPVHVGKGLLLHFTQISVRLVVRGNIQDIVALFGRHLGGDHITPQNSETVLRSNIVDQEFDEKNQIGSNERSSSTSNGKRCPGHKYVDFPIR